MRHAIGARRPRASESPPYWLAAIDIVRARTRHRSVANAEHRQEWVEGRESGE